MKNDTLEIAHLQTVTAARTLEDTAREARAWFRRVAAAQPWAEPVRRAQIAATLAAECEGRYLGESANRRQCVGLFGPSQVGKSFLMESLATFGQRSPDGPRKLMVRFPGRPAMDFTEDIAPRNDDESTGLVTRFTADTSDGSDDPAYPVKVTLLSETDLVKLLVNAFLSDFDHERKQVTFPTRERIEELLVSARSMAQAQAVSPQVDEVVMFDLGQYFRRYFKNSSEQIEQSRYWEALTEIGHRLPRAERTRLYAVLWGELPAFTELFSRLVGVLDELGHAKGVTTSLDALDKSAGKCIIDVAVLKALYDPRADGDRLDVVADLTEAGRARPVSVARSELAALTAELTMVLDHSADEVFSHTDVLDFPGARSREKVGSLPEDGEKRSALMFELLKRGKVAYLFQRYTENSDLSSMLLCVRESTQEVKGLDATVTGWIDRMQGSTPDERARGKCSLFMVLTRFDKTWSDVDASVGPDWVRGCADRRVKASLGQFLKEGWLEAWTPGVPFSNSFFVRNPKFGGLREDDVDARQRLALIRQGLDQADLCRRHVAHPEAAWDAVIGPDGGAGRLIEALREVLHPTLKVGQLRARLGFAACRLDDELKKLHRGGDDEARAERQGALKQLVTARLPSANSGAVTFYRFLSRLSMTAAEARQVYEEVVARHAREPIAAQAAATSPPPAAHLDLDDLLGDGLSVAVAAEPPPPAPARRDDADDFGNAVVAAWLDHVGRVVADRGTLAALSLDAGSVADLLEVWRSAAHRLDLAGQIAHRVGPQMRTAGRRSAAVAQRCAVIAAAAVDDFLAFNGTAEQPVERRPRSGGRPVFAFPPLPADGLPQLEEKPSHGIASLWWADWAVSLIKLGVDNVGHTGAPGGIDAHDNDTLGALRRRLRPLAVPA